MKTKWFGALERAGVVVESQPVARTALPDWIARRLARHQLTAERAALEFLADHVEGNLLAARQEVDKLALLLPAGAVTLADVEAAVVDVSRLDADMLPDAWLAGDLARYAQILTDLRDTGEAIPAFQWQMTATANALYRLKTAQARGDAANFAKNLWGRDRVRLPLYERAAARLDLARIESAVLTLAELDREAKGLRRHVDPWDTLLQLGVLWAVKAANARPNPNGKSR
jgi:DNA polymerase-3 subunit delta